MAWIQKAGLGVILFSLCFMVFFTMFDEMETNYGSDYNSSNSALSNLRNHSTSEINASGDLAISHREAIQNRSIISADAEDHLISGGFSIILDVFSYPFQIYSLLAGVIGDVFGIDYATYPWVYTSIYALLIFLTVIAILALIFKVVL